LGSYIKLNPAGFTGTTSNMQILATFTTLPIGVYILTAGVYINTTPYSTNIQFGLDGTTQNGDLQNVLSVSGAVGGVVRLTSIWVQTSAVNIYFSVSGIFLFQNITASYVRIG
jgi:hypothetical protein